MLEIKNLHATVGGKSILKGLNLKVADGVAYVATSRGLYAVELPPEDSRP